MAKKLTQKDKSEILKLYYNPEETTSTLAVRYGVSHSTISRLLKSTLLPDEYEVLIQQKRSSRGQNVADVAEPEVVEEPTPEKPKPVLTLPKKVVKEKESEELEEPEVSPEVEVSSARRSRKRSSAVASPVHEVEEELANKPAPPQVEFSEDPPEAQTNDELLDEAYNADVSTIREMLGEDLLDGEEDLDDEDDDEDLDDEDDDEDLDDEDDDEVLLTPRRRVQIGALIQVLPLSEASFPRPCYLVVDRAAELITRPLRDFGDLGQIPKDEIQQRTLPVFDNHRIARRFSNRNQRVIKVPDGRMLQKASPYLKAKGITRLLIDGQVYSLSPN
jgi:transposase-like protein